MKPNNPFLISGYSGPEYFCDREKETRAMTDALFNGRDITLMAPRRMGKTGLIRHVFHKLKEQEPDIVTIYMDIFPTQNLGDFVSVFANSVLGQLETASQKTFGCIAQFLKSCRPASTFDELTGTPKITIDVLPATEEVTLKEIFKYLKASGRRCYIAIDEFQQITEYPEKGVEALLRSYIQFIPNLNFIFAGSKQHVMQEMFMSAKRPFYQSTQPLTIGQIGADAYYGFAEKFFREKGRELHKEVFDLIYSRFEGHTWYVQNVLNRLYGYSQDIDKALVEYAIAEIIEEYSYSYEHLLAALPSGNVRLLKAIAKEKCVKEITSGSFISKHHLKAASSVNSALKKLIGNELVYKTSEGYIVYDRLIGEWLRNQVF